MGHLLHLVIPCVSICHQISGKALEEAFQSFTAPVRLVLKDTDMLSAVLSAGIEPHSGFRNGRLVVLFQHLYNRLIRMDHRLSQKLLLHVATVEGDAREYFIRGGGVLVVMI